MNYTIKASSTAVDAAIHSKGAEVPFGITPATADTLANPAELFLGSLAACILKNVARFSQLMHFSYTNAEVTLTGTRLEKPPRMDNLAYHLILYSTDEHLNVDLLKKNIEKFGTIFNTAKAASTLDGHIELRAK